jgi:hypothetical protein
MEAAQAVLQRTNAAIDREERLEAVEELKRLVEDWKGHRIDAFGELLLFGTHTVLKGDSTNTKDNEREVSSLCPFWILFISMYKRCVFWSLLTHCSTKFTYSKRFYFAVRK